MDLFRKGKKADGDGEDPPAPEDSKIEKRNNDDSKTATVGSNKKSVDGLDGLLADSDEDEGAEVFDDDDDEGDTPSRSHAGSVSASSTLSPKSFKEVVQNLGVSNFLIPKMVQHENIVSMDADGRGDSFESSEEEEDVTEYDEEHEDDGEDDKGSESAEDYTDDEDEGQEGYKVGGYHPVTVGELYNQR